MNVTATLFGQMLTFAVLVWFIKGVLWEPMLRMMEQRKQRIADGLAAAEHGQHEQELAEKRAKEILKEAKEQAQELITQAQRRAGEIVEESKGTARLEGERILASARVEIDQQTNQAKEALRRQVVELALAGATQVLQKEVHAAEHNELLERLAGEL